MRIETIALPSRTDGLILSALIAQPDGDAKGLVQVAHGMAEHKERYQGFMEALADAGYASLVSDHRGHGASLACKDERGWFGAEALVDDMRQWTELFKARFPGLPLCLFGHSMGSLAARAYVRGGDAAIDSLVLSGCPGENPMVGVGLKLSRALRSVYGDHRPSPFLGWMTNKDLRGSMPKGSSEFAWLNTDQDEVDKYERDEMCGFVFNHSGYEALFMLMQWAYARDGWALTKPGLPILFISGADDPCMVNRGKLDEAVSRMREAGYRDVTLRVYDGMRHEILLEPDRARVYADMIAFLNRTQEA